MPEGISASNRERLARLLRAVSGPFTAGEGARALEIGRPGARRFLTYLAARGWLVRVRHGLYAAIPLDAEHPAEWREDPWVIAMRTFAPCYIAGYNAGEHWGLTDQLFRSVVVVTGRPARRNRHVVQDTEFRLKAVSPDQLFGLRAVWRGRVRVQVSDPARTMADLLNDPALGGGIRHVADMLAEWFAGEHRADGRLLDYMRRIGNRSAYKRLGFLVERRGITAPVLVSECRKRMSAGIVRLDPAAPARGRRLLRWNLQLNVRLPATP